MADATNAVFDTTESPWAMQFAARVEKLDPPRVEHICAAAALAVITLLEDPRALSPNGQWAPAIDAWQGGGRIRKLVRRARASAWLRAQLAPGITVTVDGAQVRAFAPSQMDAVPEVVRKLQIQSSPLEAPAPVEECPAGLRPTDPASADGDLAMVIAVTPRFDMSWGKQAAQCAHAAQVLWREADAVARERWHASGRQVLVLHPEQGWWAGAVDGSHIQIRDGGFTEIPAGTMSSVAWWASTPDVTDAMVGVESRQRSR